MPDAALTVYERGKVPSLRAYFGAGLAEPGEYACPECDGDGRVFDGAPSGGRRCQICLGSGMLSIAQGIPGYCVCIAGPLYRAWPHGADGHVCHCTICAARREALAVGA